MTKAPRVHPHIVATGGRPDSVTHYLCPASPAGESSHHPVPRYARHGEDVVNTTTCSYCGKTEKQLREELEL